MSEWNSGSERYDDRDSLLAPEQFHYSGTNKGDDWFNRRTGMVKQSCTDIFCCSIFGIFLIAMLGLITYSIIEGNHKKLYHGMDTDGKFCGIDLPEQEYVYFCKAHAHEDTINFENPICVTSCPDPGSDMMPCKLGSQPSYGSHAVAGFYCYPDSDTMMTQLSSKMAEYPALKIVADMYMAILDTWPIMVVVAFTSMLVGYMYLFMLRSFAQTIISVVSIVCVVGFIVLGIYLFVASFVGGMDGIWNSGDGWGDRIFGIILFLIGCVLGAVSCWARKYMKKTVGTLKVACECLFQCPALLAEPLLATVTRLIVNFILIVGFMLVLSTGTPVKEQVFHTFEYDFMQWMMVIFYFCMFLWINEIMYALSVWAVAYVVERWFFQPHDELGIKPSLPCSALFNGYGTALVCHLGTLAGGSVIIGLTRPIRLVWMLCVQFLMCGGNCEQQYWATVGLYNKDAYMDQALFSNDFFPSARHGALGIHDHKDIVILAGTCWLVEFIGLAMLFLSGSMMMFFQMKLCQPFSSSESNYYMPDPVVPSVTAGLISMLIGTPFMLSFGQIADTMLFCYGIEPEMLKLKVVEAAEEVKGFFTRLGEEVVYLATFQWLASDKSARGVSKPKTHTAESAAPEWFKKWVHDSPLY